MTTFAIANLSDVNFGQLSGSMTGDVLGAASGTNLATTIQPNVVTYAKFQQVAAASLVGNPTGGLANAGGITLGATLAFAGTVVQTSAATGDVTWAANSFATSIAASAVTTAKIANSAVTYAKLQNESANTLLGNANSIAGAPFEVALGSTLLMSGSTTLITGAGTGDVTWNPNAFLTTVAKIQGVTVSGVTGTGNVVFSASPTLSGTVTASALTAGGAITFSGLTTAGIVLNSAAGLLSTSTALPNGTTATTQSAGDNSTKVATTAYADANFLRLTLSAQSFTGGVRTTAANQGTISSGILTLDSGNGPLQYVTNGGAFTIAAPANDGSLVLMITNNVSAGTITFSGFTNGVNIGDPLTTTNSSKFKLYVDRINGVSSYTIKALQ